VALAVTVTAVSSAGSVVTLPLILLLGLGRAVGGEAQVSVPVGSLLVPAILGMVARAAWPERVRFQNRQDRPYIHLVDGGVSDNIGMRMVLETFEQLGTSAAYRAAIGFGEYRRIVVIVVNARSSPRTEWDRREAPPGFMVQLLQSSSVPIDRYSFETVETMKDRVQLYAWRRELLLAEARLAGATDAEAETKADAILPKLDLYPVSVSFDELPDPQERDYFMNLPTSFALPAAGVDRLRDVAGRLMRQSPDYQRMLRAFGATVATPGPAETGVGH
jgi:NTE family protein